MLHIPGIEEDKNKVSMWFGNKEIIGNLDQRNFNQVVRRETRLVEPEKWIKFENIDTDRNVAMKGNEVG